MPSPTRILTERLQVEEFSAFKWKRRRDIPLAILAWIGLLAVILWAASHIVRSLLILVIAAILAYALAPAVKFLQRVMPRFLAILIVYLIVLSLISLLFYFVVSTAIHQIINFSDSLRRELTPGQPGSSSPLEQTLLSFGITPPQITAARQQMLDQTRGLATSAIPFLRGLFDFVLDTIVVAVLSIYLIIDGKRVNNWLRRNTPRQHRERTHFLIDTLERVVGGYIRGQLTLAVLIGLLVGIGMAIMRVPYPVLLGVLAFSFAFVPVLGTFVSGAACVLLALTNGWQWAVAVLIYFVLIHVFESELVGPRIVGKAVGLHPIVSLLALIAGAELFGIWGALFASPIAGVAQAVLISLWQEWKATHADQFVDETDVEGTDETQIASAEYIDTDKTTKLSDTTRTPDKA